MSEMTFKSKKKVGKPPVSNCRLVARAELYVDPRRFNHQSLLHLGLWPAMQVLLLELARSSETKKNRNFLHAKEALKGDTCYRT